MNRLESMSAFVTVVEHGGFSAAARQLAKPLATVSRKVADLETELGVRLLNRTTRQVTLTDSGRDYFEACRRILADLDEAERAAAGEHQAPRGELVVTAPIVFGRLHIVPLVTELMAAYPELTVKLLLVDRVVDLIDEHGDAAIRIGELPDSSLVAVSVGEIKRVISASPAYLERRGRPETLADLERHDCILVTALTPGQAWIIRDGNKIERRAIRPRMTVTTAGGGIDAAIAGAGLVQTLCYQVSAEVRAGRLALVLQEFEPPHVPVNIVYPSGRLMPAKLRAFLDFMAPRLRKRLQENWDC